MSTDKIEDSKDELTDKEMDKVSGGGGKTTTTTTTTTTKSEPSLSEITITKHMD
jgi:bacteriocin-like protein